MGNFSHLLQGGISAFRFCNHFKACLAAVDICACGMGMKYIALTVNKKMAFDTFGFLEAVNSLDRVRQSASTACTVNETYCRRDIPSTFPSGIFKKEAMDFIESAFGIPVSPFVIHRFSSADNIRVKVAIGNHCAEGRISHREYGWGHAFFCISSNQKRI